MPRIIKAPTADELKSRLAERLKWAKKLREGVERQWKLNSEMTDSPSGTVDIPATVSFSSRAELGDDLDANLYIGTNYIFKYVRFLHSQLSANPPSVVISPTSADSEDKRRADAADRILRHVRENKNFQEVVDQCTLKVLKKSIGWVKVVWNPDKGDIFDFNEETREVLMEGDLDIYSPATEDIWIDPDARRWEEVKYTFERMYLSKEEAMFRFPDAGEIIEGNLERIRKNMEITDRAEIFEPKIEVFEYYEKGTPLNGGMGVRAYILEDGTLLERPTKNPHFKSGLPLKPLTYIDQEENLYSKSVVEYAAPLQDYLNRMDSAILDNVQTHGAVRMYLPGGTDIDVDSITDEPDMIIRGTGAQAPHFINAPNLMPDIWKHRQVTVEGIQELFGINDSMLGIQKREQSAVSQQTAVEMGTAVHRRLFIKYAMFVESVFRDCIGLIKENWDEPRMVLVLGKEKAFEAAQLQGSDVAGGFDFKVEHGTSLPLDPNARREFLLLNMPLFKEAGVGAREILRLMKLDDVGGAFDRLEMAADRQREIFEEMEMHWRKGNPMYIPPEPMEDHLGRLEWARSYLETSEFKYLPDGLKELIRQHIRDRMALSAQETASTADPNVMPAGMPGVGGAQAPSVGGPLEQAGIL